MSGAELGELLTELRARTPGVQIEDLVALLSRFRFTITSEAELQEGIERVLLAERITFTREHRLDAKDRPDFLVLGGIAIEVKVGGSAAALARQVHRYAQHPEVTGILVVTTRYQHGLPEALNGKPIRIHRAGGVL